MQVKVEQITDTIREIYSFNCFDFNVVFVGYTKQEKPIGKRAWKTLKYWDKYNLRDSTLTEPNLTFQIRSVALEKAKEAIRVYTWNDWKNIK